MLIDGIDYKIASEAEEIKKAYKLVYDNYIDKQFCKLNIHKMRIFLFDSLPATRTFIAKEGDDVLATATLVFDSPIGLPSEGLFKDRLEQLRSEEKKICEISKLSTKRDLGINTIRILTYLFRSCWLYAKERNPHTHFCIMVEPQNEAFYLKSFFFERNTPIRKDPKANEADSLFLEMPLDIKEKCSENLSKRRNKKRYKMHFEDPDIQKILTQQKNTEENLTKINVSLQTPKNKSTLALTSEEKQFLKFKFFIIRYNLEQIHIMAINQSSKGSLHEAAESYENLMKTLPTWAFRTEKDEIYGKLAEFFFHMCDFQKVYELGEQLKKSTNNSISIQGRNLRGLSQLFLIDQVTALKELDEARKLAKEDGDHRVLARNLQYTALIMNNAKKDHEKALELINQSIELAKDAFSINEMAILYFIALRANMNLGRLNDCKKIILFLKKENELADKHKKLINQLNYNSSMGNYFQTTNQNKKALYYFENILNNILKVDDAPINYSVSASMASRSYFLLGHLEKALHRTQKNIDMRNIEKTNIGESNNYLGYVLNKLNILLFINDQTEIHKVKEEIKKELKTNKDKNKETSFQYALRLECLLNGEFPELLKSLKTLKTSQMINKPQLTNSIDMPTAYLLNNKPAKAKKHLGMKLSQKESGIIGSDIDNQVLIKIYNDLANLSIDHLIEDIQELLQNSIDKDEIIIRGMILKNIIHIIDAQNSKKQNKSYPEIRKTLINMFAKLIEDKNIPIFDEFLSKANK